MNLTTESCFLLQVLYTAKEFAVKLYTIFAVTEAQMNSDGSGESLLKMSQKTDALENLFLTQNLQCICL